MGKHDNELIAALLGDANPSVRLREWLRTPAGQRELAAYRDTLTTINATYGPGTDRPLLVLSYAIVNSPIGRLVLAATRVGLVRVSFRRPVATVVDDLRRRWHAEVRESTDHMKDASAQLDAYFAGRRRSFDLPIDLSLATPFQRRVLLATRSVAAGEVVSYAEIARRIGQPHASRAVGQALGSNPIPIVIPCHRIVASGGKLGGYTGGLAIKKKLLALEGAET